MKTYAYSVTVEGQGNQHIINTNDVFYAIHEFLRAHACGCEVCVCNGYTGEVLCHNDDEPYTTDEMGLMIEDYLSIFGLPDGVELNNEEEEPAPVEAIGGEMVLALIDQLMAEGLPS